MEAVQSTASRYAEIYRDALDVIQSLNKVSERIHRPDSLVTDSEASQSLECLRADLSRISGDVEALRATTNTEYLGSNQPPESWSAPLILSGLALGFFLEKP